MKKILAFSVLYILTIAIYEKEVKTLQNHISSYNHDMDNFEKIEDTLRISVDTVYANCDGTYLHNESLEEASSYLRDNPGALND